MSEIMQRLYCPCFGSTRKNGQLFDQTTDHKLCELVLKTKDPIIPGPLITITKPLKIFGWSPYGEVFGVVHRTPGVKEQILF